MLTTNGHPTGSPHLSHANLWDDQSFFWHALHNSQSTYLAISSRYIAFVPVHWSSTVQTSNMIWLCTLQYHSIGYDRFFWLWSLLHAVFTQTVCLCPLPPLLKCNNPHCGHPYEIPDLQLPKRPDINLTAYQMWVINHQVYQTKCRMWMISLFSSVLHSRRY